MGDFLYQACIFDLDGTLANTLNSIAYFANGALTACGYSTIEVEKYRYLVGNGADKLVRRMLNTVTDSFTEDEVNHLRKTYDTLYESDSMYLVTGYDGIQKLLEALKRSNMKLAVLSNKPHNVTEEVVRSLFGNDVFDLCYGQRPQVERKPSPQGALLIAKELGITPEQCLYIGDTNVDMRTGEAAGMNTVGVLWGFRDRDELEQSHATYIVTCPREIYSIAIPNLE